MCADVLDAMAAHAIEVLVAGDPAAVRGLVAGMARRWPQVEALAIAFALAQAGAHIEDNIDSAPARRPPELAAYRLAALVAADVFALQAMGRERPRASELLHFWRRVGGLPEP